MNDYISVNITSADQLRQCETVRLRSWKGDYLHRPDGPGGVTTWPTGEMDWSVERAASGRFCFKSWKGDYLHRPDGPPGVTTWPVGEIEWTVEVGGGAIRLKSWRGDYLCRLDAPAGVTTSGSGGLDWSVERKRPDWRPWLDLLVKGPGIGAAGIYGQQDGACFVASPGLEITASAARALGAGLRDPSPLQAAGATITGQKFMYLTTERPPVTLVLRKGSVSALVVNTLTTTIIVLTRAGSNPANITLNANVAAMLIKQGY